VAWTDTDLAEAVKRLAAPAVEQIAYVRKRRCAPSLDELALEFDDEFQRLRDPDAARSTPAEYLAALKALDAQLDRMSGPANADLWVEDALARPEWREVRQLATRALAARAGT
jgi:hypothetical protein